MKSRYDVAPLEGYDPQIGLLLASLIDSTREWLEYLEEPSLDAMVWQQVENGPSIGSLILHNIDVEAYWFESFAAQRDRPSGEAQLLLSEETKVDEALWPVAPREPFSWYLDLLQKVRARAFEALKGIEPEREYEGRTINVTLRWIVAHVVEHDSYHGGQAVLLHEAWKKLHQ